MAIVTLYEKPKLKKPALLAAWPGMGNVAVTAVSYLKKQVGAKPLGEMNDFDFFAPTGATISNQLIQSPTKAVNQFYYYQSPSKETDLLIFIGSMQPIPHREYEFAKAILEAAVQFDVQTVYTTAAAPSDMRFHDTPRVFAVPNERSMVNQISEYHVHFMSEGNIAGLNGLLIAAASEIGIQGLCLLGEIPFFTAQMDFPRASLKVLDVLTKLLKLKIDLLDLELYVSQKEREIEPLADLLAKNDHSKNKPPVQAEDKSMMKAVPQEEPIPKAVRSRVEKLFEQAEFDRTYKSKMQLKEELDKWGLFDEYLDRFLDLFKKDQNESGS